MSTVISPANCERASLRAADGSHRWERLLPRLDRIFGLPVLAAAAFALMVYLLLPKSMADPDIWWHLRDAAVQWQMTGWLHTDVLSATGHGAAWMNHEWLAEVPFYLGWLAAGPRGVLLVSMAVTETVLLLTYVLCWRLTRSVGWTLLFSLLAALDASVSFGPRTLLFGWLCLNIELLLLERWCSGRLRERTAVWAFPALFALWVNLHGSWVIGLVLLCGMLVCNAVVRAAERPWAARCGLGSLRSMLVWPRRRDGALWKAAGFSAGALLLNPYGWRLVLYPFDMAFRQTLNIASVEEWRTLDFHTPRAKIFLLMLFALFAVQLLRRTRWALWELFFVAVGVWAAMEYSRFLFLAGLLVCPLAAKQVAACFKREADPVETTPGWRGFLHMALMAAMLPVVVAQFPSRGQMAQAERGRYPVQAMEPLRGMALDGLMLNQYTWGGFVEWHLPRARVFVDSRADVFERNGALQDYLDVTQLRHPLEILDRRGVRYVLFERDAPLPLLLKATGRWRVRYEDATAVLLERVL